MGIIVLAISLITQFLFPTPLVCSAHCFWKSGASIEYTRKSISSNSLLNFNNATLTNKLNSTSVSIFAGTPVVPTFDKSKSPLSGLHLAQSSLCSCSEINFVSCSER